MTLGECAEAAGLPIRRMPLRVVRAMARTTWRVRMSETPPGQVEFARWPWVVSNARIKQITGWKPRHSSRETFEITMRAHGKIADGSGVPGGL